MKGEREERRGEGGEEDGGRRMEKGRENKRKKI